MNPVFLLCSGRTGGTFLADLLARMPGMSLFIEPFHHLIPERTNGNPARTDVRLGHPTVHYPMRGYTRLDARELSDWHGKRHSDPRGYLTWLVGASPKRPVIKLCRFHGQRRQLFDWFPDATFIYLERDCAQQAGSMVKVGMPPDYFGALSGHGLGHHSVQWDKRGRDLFLKAWHACQAEALSLAPNVWPLTYEELLRDPKYHLSYLAKWIGHDPSEGEKLAHLVARPSTSR